MKNALSLSPSHPNPNPNPNPTPHPQAHCKEDFADLLSALDKMRTDGMRRRTQATEKSKRRRLSDRPGRKKYDPSVWSLGQRRNKSAPTLALPK